MLTPSLPKIQADYGVASGQVSLILALYTVFGTAINPIVGKLGDIYGKKRILTMVLNHLLDHGHDDLLCSKL